MTAKDEKPGFVRAFNERLKIADEYGKKMQTMVKDYKKYKQDQQKDKDKDKDKKQNKKDEKNKSGDKSEEKDKDKGKDKDKNKENNKDKGKEQNEEQQPKPGQMSKEDALRILNALDDQEKHKTQKMKAGRGKGNVKDW